MIRAISLVCHVTMARVLTPADSFHYHVYCLDTLYESVQQQIMLTVRCGQGSCSCIVYLWLMCRCQASSLAKQNIVLQYCTQFAHTCGVPRRAKAIARP